jgi:hypothetical protein
MVGVNWSELHRDRIVLISPRISAVNFGNVSVVKSISGTRPETAG